MGLDERAAERVRAMVTKAEQLLGTYRAPPPNFIGSEGWVDTDLFAEWRAQSLNLLRQLLSPAHTYSASFEECTQKAGVPSSVKRGMGVLRAVGEDLAGGYLFDVQAIIAAEVFADFLEMAEHLLSEGYKDAAASLAGAVLEDGLRRVAEAAEQDVSRRDGLDSLNQKLLRSGTYTKLVGSKVDSWRQVRNAADHGHFDEYGPDDVRLMIDGVRDQLDRLLNGAGAPR